MDIKELIPNHLLEQYLKYNNRESFSDLNVLEQKDLLLSFYGHITTTKAFLNNIQDFLSKEILKLMKTEIKQRQKNNKYDITKDNNVPKKFINIINKFTDDNTNTSIDKQKRRTENRKKKK